MPKPQENKKYTYVDYLTWPEGERWEIIDGVPLLQAAPTWQHQAISIDLSRQFANYLQGKECRVFAAPFDLCIAETNKDDEENDENDENEENDEAVSNIFQPDVVVVCEESKLRKTGYFGVPSLIVEISSPSTTRNDKVLKFNKYEMAGVKEYWIVEPEGKFVSVFTLQENKRYGRPETYTDVDKIKVSMFPDLLVDLSSAFASI